MFLRPKTERDEINNYKGTNEEALEIVHEYDINFSNTVISMLQLEHKSIMENDVALYEAGKDGFFKKVLNFIKDLFSRLIKWLKSVKDSISKFFKRILGSKSKDFWVWAKTVKADTAIKIAENKADSVRDFFGNKSIKVGWITEADDMLKRVEKVSDAVTSGNFVADVVKEGKDKYDLVTIPGVGEFEPNEYKQSIKNFVITGDSDKSESELESDVIDDSFLKSHLADMVKFASSTHVAVIEKKLDDLVKKAEKAEKEAEKKMKENKTKLTKVQKKVSQVASIISSVAQSVKTGWGKASSISLSVLEKLYRAKDAYESGKENKNESADSILDAFNFAL
jgi:hypothetical protein